MKMDTIKSLASGSVHALSVSARAIAGVAVVGTVVGNPLLLGAAIFAAAVAAANRSDEEKLTDFVRAIYHGRRPGGKDGGSWLIEREGEGYIVKTGRGQCFRPEGGRTWNKGEAADRAAQLAGFAPASI